MVGGSDMLADQTDTQQPFEKIKQFITKHFPGDHEITNEWCGTILIRADNLPYVFHIRMLAENCLSRPATGKRWYDWFGLGITCLG